MERYVDNVVGLASLLLTSSSLCRVSERAELSVTARFFATTSRVRSQVELLSELASLTRSFVFQVSPSLLFVVSLVVVA